MKKIIVIGLLALFTAAAVLVLALDYRGADEANAEACGVACMAKNKSTEASCKLPPKEMQERKERVLPWLKQAMQEKKSLDDGYAFRFKGDDSTLVKLVDFVASERRCCDFFVYNLSISGDQSEIWLEMRGDADAKAFIDNELNL
ncbi:MAG TPA: hypothetical protein VFV37_01365 [Luteibaculaceae bacterium]|nr:hypothetical protein [Luteibaculaceae bacterium]